MGAYPLSGGLPPAHSRRPTRRDRTEAVLASPDTVLVAALSCPDFRKSLTPFRRRSNGHDVYDVVAFVHAFGVAGPTEGDWDILFRSSGLLQPEDIAVLVAIAATGGCEGLKGMKKLHVRDLVRDVVFGIPSDKVPGLLNMVCTKFDEWLLSPSALRLALHANAEEAARAWSLSPLDEGLYVWGREGISTSGVVAEHALGDALVECARRIAVEETRAAVALALQRVSVGGMDAVMARVHMRADDLVDVAAEAAEGVLVRRVYECLEQGSVARLPSPLVP